MKIEAKRFGYPITIIAIILQDGAFYAVAWNMYQLRVYPVEEIQRP